MPQRKPASGRLEVVAVALAAIVMIMVVFTGHTLTAPTDHVLGPDLLYAGVVSVLCLGGIAFWARAMRR